MTLRTYRDNDWQAVAELLNSVFSHLPPPIRQAAQVGYIRDGLLERTDGATVSKAWVSEQHKVVRGFISAHVDRSRRGIVTTPVCQDILSDTGQELLNAAEGFLRESGAASAHFDGVCREYRVPIGGPIHMHLLNRGYDNLSTQVALMMWLDLARVPDPSVVGTPRRNESEGLIFEFLTPRYGDSLKELGHGWALGPGEARSEEYPCAICRDGDTVIGFCGRCSIRKRYSPGCTIGEWTFVFVKEELGDEKYRRRGIGSALVHMANQWLRDNGATYHLLATDIDNPAMKIYRQAGYKCLYLVNGPEKHL